ncbi:hypothetical protein TR2A62_2010 [Thalassobium sp. R2A62]|nr:hypothetical protein TR2A62_2010 [Thalassobium sp. R2A62]
MAVLIANAQNNSEHPPNIARPALRAMQYGRSGMARIAQHTGQGGLLTPLIT